MALLYDNILNVSVLKNQIYDKFLVNFRNNCKLGIFTRVFAILGILGILCMHISKHLTFQPSTWLKNDISQPVSECVG